MSATMEMHERIKYEIASWLDESESDRRRIDLIRAVRQIVQGVTVDPTVLALAKRNVSQATGVREADLEFKPSRIAVTD